MILITEMLEICIQTSYDQNVQLILKSYLPVVYGTTLAQYRQTVLNHRLYTCTHNTVIKHLYTQGSGHPDQLYAELYRHCSNQQFVYTK